MKKVFSIACNFALHICVMVCALTILSRLIAVSFLLEKYQNIVGLLEVYEPLFAVLGSIPIVM